MTIQASNFEQHTGFAFNSNDFSMHSASGCTLLPMVTSAMMEDWDSEHNEDEDAPKSKLTLILRTAMMPKIKRY